MEHPALGKVILLNGPPRSGKSSIAREIQRTFDGVWMNLGVDAFVREITPERYRPGIGLRPPIAGDEEVAAEIGRLVPKFYDALHACIAELCRHGFNVVADVGYHRGYTAPLESVNRYLGDIDVLFVGVRCSLEEIMRRRNAGQPGREGQYVQGTDGEIPEAVIRWQTEVHRDHVYDLEVDTTSMTAEACAEIIRQFWMMGEA